MTRQSQSWVLAVEDSETDLYLLQRILDEQVMRARDGQQGIELLDELAAGGRERFPGLIVIDLNLPRVDGYGVLARLRARQVFHEIPVIVVTCSEAEART